MKNFKAVFIIFAAVFVVSCSQVEEKSSVSLNIPATELVARGIVREDELCTLNLEMFYTDFYTDMKDKVWEQGYFEEMRRTIEEKGTPAQLTRKTYIFDDLEAGRTVRILCGLNDNEGLISLYGHSEDVVLSNGANNVTIKLSGYGEFSQALFRKLVPNYETITEYKIPNGYDSIGSDSQYETDGTFYEHKNLTSVTVPSTVTYIKKGSFKYCENLKTLILKSETPVRLEQSYTNTFYSESSDFVIYVPQGVKKLYEDITLAGTNWNGYIDRIQEMN